MSNKRPTQGPGVDSSPLGELSVDDQEFVLHLVLASGSLKGLAAHYQVSYPTIRGRLDRLIQRLEAIRQGRPADPMKDLLAQMIAEGRVEAATAKTIHAAHRGVLDSQRNTHEEA